VAQPVASVKETTMSDPVASPSLSRLGVKNQVPLETESVANKKTTIKGCNYQLGELAGN
jgi:hypothetical protein